MSGTELVTAPQAHDPTPKPTPTPAPEGWTWAQHARVGGRTVLRRHLVRASEVDLPIAYRAERYDALCGQQDVRWVVISDDAPECGMCAKKARKGLVPMPAAQEAGR